MTDLTQTAMYGGKLVYAVASDNEQIVTAYFSIAMPEEIDFPNWLDPDNVTETAPPCTDSSFAVIIHTEGGWYVPMLELVESEESVFSNLTNKTIPLIQGTSKHNQEDIVYFFPGISYKEFMEQTVNLVGKTFMMPLVSNMLPPVQTEMFDQSYAMFMYAISNAYMMRNSITLDGDNNPAYAHILAGMAADYMMINNSAEVALQQFTEVMSTVKDRFDMRCSTAAKALN
jgi:hypothetical protein